MWVIIKAMPWIEGMQEEFHKYQAEQDALSEGKKRTMEPIQSRLWARMLKDMLEALQSLEKKEDQNKMKATTPGNLG